MHGTRHGQHPGSPPLVSATPCMPFSRASSPTTQPLQCAPCRARQRPRARRPRGCPSWSYRRPTRESAHDHAGRKDCRECRDPLLVSPRGSLSWCGRRLLHRCQSDPLRAQPEACRPGCPSRAAPCDAPTPRLWEIAASSLSPAKDAPPPRQMRLSMLLRPRVVPDRVAEAPAVAHGRPTCSSGTAKCGHPAASSEACMTWASAEGAHSSRR